MFSQVVKVGFNAVLVLRYGCEVVPVHDILFLLLIIVHLVHWVHWVVHLIHLIHWVHLVHLVHLHFVQTFLLVTLDSPSNFNVCSSNWVVVVLIIHIFILVLGLKLMSICAFWAQLVHVVVQLVLSIHHSSCFIVIPFYLLLLSFRIIFIVETQSIVG